MTTASVGRQEARTMATESKDRTRFLELRRAVETMHDKPTEASLVRLERLALHARDNKSDGLLKSKLAAVLILLGVDRQGELQVVLTTRAATLRAHPGETAFPGGKMDLEDTSVEETAVNFNIPRQNLKIKLREAYEECRIDKNRPEFRMMHLTTIETVVSRNFLFVTPCVFLLLSPLDQALTAMVPSPAEVDKIFLAPLGCVGVRPSPESEFKYTFQDVDWLGNRKYRLHNLTHSSFPAKLYGMTHDVLLLVQEIAHATKLSADFRADDQLTYPEYLELVIAMHAKQTAVSD